MPPSLSQPNNKRSPAFLLRWLFDSQSGPTDRLLPRWIFLRALGAIYFSAFFSLFFQIRGLIGPNGILPAANYLQALKENYSHVRFWYAPTLLWFSSGSHMLIALCWIGMIAALLLTLNFWPRATLAICFVCFLSFVTAARDFSGYQSDGMLLEAGFISLFFAPPGLRPKFGAAHPPSRMSLFLLIWECFRIYFESGVAKMLGHDPQWRNFTALDEYYQNGPLPTWIGWYMQQRLPHRFHAATTGLTLALELVLIFLIFLPRRFRFVLFLIITPWQVGIILSANYTFLNYIVLFLGFLILDDRFLAPTLPQRWRPSSEQSFLTQSPPNAEAEPSPQIEAVTNGQTWQSLLLTQYKKLKLSFSVVALTWIFYATTAQMLWMFGQFPLPTTPVAAIDPLRIANRYGLFAVMTRGRYEIEFQGSNDGQTWTPYPFRFKPQDPAKAPGIYAPYQPRFDWNLWFASLTNWRDDSIPIRTEQNLLRGDHDVLALFASNPFPNAPPKQIRAVIWQYWFTTPAEKRTTGMWWRRQLLGLYAPTLESQPDGKVVVLQWPTPVTPLD